MSRTQTKQSTAFFITSLFTKNINLCKFLETPLSEHFPVGCFNITDEQGH